MNPALLIRLRPVTPWRIGPDSGAREQAAAVYPSDTLFSAVCSAFDRLGWLEEWLSVTVRGVGEPAVRFTSAFPFHRGLLYLPPPAGYWPPRRESLVRWKGAQLLPAQVLAGLLEGQMPAEQDWTIDAQSGCLVPSRVRGAAGPYRFLRRSHAAVDRLTAGNAEPYAVNCVQFAPEAGLWCATLFSSPTAGSAACAAAGSAAPGCPCSRPERSPNSCLVLRPGPPPRILPRGGCFRCSRQRPMTPSAGTGAATSS